MPDPSPKIKVLFVDDHADILGALRGTARLHADLEVAGALTEAAGLFEAVERLRPDILVLDLSVPETNPYDAIRRVIQTSPSTRVIVFTGHDDPETRRRSCEAGAAGFASKHLDLTDLFQLIRSIGNDGNRAP
jgi:DNA-binding NarL/FixJ family response regulator